ncbi:MAG TPA: hypothetical protein DCX10_12445, partial [Verrucomicrobiales bacterium]|nr:hypothetical protein [Verrucomicrobiales bacterium]
FMMYLRLELSWLLLMTIGVHAGPLQWGQVSDDAQWVAHFDFEGLRQTSFYKEVSEELLQQYISEAETEIKRSSGIDITIDSVLSVTAFGKSANKAPDEDGILMMEITPTLKTIAMDWLWNSHGAKPNELPVSVSKIDAAIEYLYSIDGEILIAADTNSNHLCIGRNKELIIHFINILGTQKQRGAAKRQFKDYPSPKGTMAYIAIANTFDGAQLPAQQAKILQMSKGASMAAGESNENIFLKLLLSTEGSGASLQIQRVLAGVQAVAMLNAKQPEWFPVLQAIDIRNEDQRVWVDWNMSLQNATNFIHALQGSTK